MILNDNEVLSTSGRVILLKGSLYPTTDTTGVDTQYYALE